VNHTTDAVAETWVQFGNPEEDERLPLEKVARRLVKTQQAKKSVACALVNSKVCESVKWL
jgi:hypothetical protein